MKKPTPVLLITSAVHPASDELVLLRDSDERIRYTLIGIDEWLARIPDLKIVICDGTDFDFAPIVRQRWLQAHIETLHFANDSDVVAIKGKGYGEGEIIIYALAHSRLLKSARTFMKCTAKLWVDNIHDVLSAWPGGNSFKIRTRKTGKRDSSGRPDVEYTWFDTRFYIVRKRFFQRHLRTAYLQTHRPDRYVLEHAYRDRVVGLRGLSRWLCVVVPEIKGMSGTKGTSF